MLSSNDHDALAGFTLGSVSFLGLVPLLILTAWSAIPGMVYNGKRIATAKRHGNRSSFEVRLTRSEAIRAANARGAQLPFGSR